MNQSMYSKLAFVLFTASSEYFKSLLFPSNAIYNLIVSPGRRNNVQNLQSGKKEDSILFSNTVIYPELGGKVTFWDQQVNYLFTSSRIPHLLNYVFDSPLCYSTLLFCSLNFVCQEIAALFKLSDIIIFSLYDSL